MHEFFVPPANSTIGETNLTQHGSAGVRRADLEKLVHKHREFILTQSLPMAVQKPLSAGHKQGVPLHAVLNTNFHDVKLV